MNPSTGDRRAGSGRTRVRGRAQAGPQPPAARPPRVDRDTTHVVESVVTVAETPISLTRLFSEKTTS